MTDIEIVIKLDTSGFRSSERELERSKTRVRKRRNQAASKRRPLSKRLSKAAGAVVGFSVVQRILGAASAGNVDPWEEALVPTKAFADSVIFDKTGVIPKADQRAREDTANTHAAQFRVTKNSEGYRQYYQVLQRMTQAEEEGRLILRQDSRFIGPSLSELTAKAIPGFIELIGKSFVYMADAITR